MTPTANYKMPKSTKTWLAVNKARLEPGRYSLVKRCLINADIEAARPVKNNKRDAKPD